MSYDIRYLPLAAEDIHSLAEYLSRFYPSTAGRVLSEIEQAIAGLKQHPRMYQHYNHDHFYRRMVAGGYLVFYHIEEQNQSIDIHRVLPGGWDISKMLEER